jgi:hypothetical protein
MGAAVESTLIGLISGLRFIAKAIEPVLGQRRLPSYTSGLDAIRRGRLQTHPIFREYPDKVLVRGFLEMYSPQPTGQTPVELFEANALTQAAKLDPMAPFALPGQPYYRRMLGWLAAPPAIQFANFSWSARRPVTLKVMALQAGTVFQDTFQELSEKTQARVARFRAAEKAVSLGLPPDAFESKR